MIKYELIRNCLFLFMISYHWYFYLFSYISLSLFTYIFNIYDYVIHFYFSWLLIITNIVHKQFLNVFWNRTDASWSNEHLRHVLISLLGHVCRESIRTHLSPHVLNTYLQIFFTIQNFGCCLWHHEPTLGYFLWALISCQHVCKVSTPLSSAFWKRWLVFCGFSSTLSHLSTSL